jgi:(R)-3-[(carboxymethyl)amino]fatty acid dioxygenase/decarboxylase
MPSSHRRRRVGRPSFSQPIAMKVSPPRSATIGAEVLDLDPRRVTAAEVAAIKELVHRHKLVVFRGIDMTDAEYLTLARRFGRPQVYFQDHYHHPEHPEIFVSSNVPMDGRKVGVAGTGRFWHSDYQFFDEPLSWTFVYPKVIPRGHRATLYVDMVEAWWQLPPHLRRELEAARCYHEAVMYYKVQPRDIDRAIAELMDEFRQLSPGASHPAVITHPVTGEQALYVSEGFTMKVEGRTAEDSQRILREVFEFLAQPRRVHEHAWGAGDLMLWENRTLIHRSSGIPKGEQSVSYRIGVYDGTPFYVGCKLAETPS